MNLPRLVPLLLQLLMVLLLQPLVVVPVLVVVVVVLLVLLDPQDSPVVNLKVTRRRFLYNKSLCLNPFLNTTPPLTSISLPVSLSPLPLSGEPSDTMLFVANLPFSIQDEDLKEIFADYKPVSARVVRLTRSGRSKGFGFVSVANKAEQTRVLTELENVVVGDRTLVIKVAMSSQVEPRVTGGGDEQQQ